MKLKMSEILRNLRKEKKLTQQMMANETGLSVSAVKSYENGLREPNSKAMVILEEYFQVNGAYLRGETDERETFYTWQDDEIMNAVKDSFSNLFDNLLKATRLCNDCEQKMIFDIIVELSHVLISESMTINQRSAALLLLQEVFALSTRFVDVCTHSEKSTIIEDNRVLKMKQSCIEQYELALEKAEKAI